MRTVTERECIARTKEVADDVKQLRWDLLHPPIPLGDSVRCPACNGRGGDAETGACGDCEGEGTRFVPSGVFDYSTVGSISNRLDKLQRQLDDIARAVADILEQIAIPG